jgi:hypothetical protein
VKHAVQRGIWVLCFSSRTEENHGKPWSSWTIEGPFGCKLNSSQQSGIKYANPNISPYLWCCFIWKKVYIFFFTSISFYVHILDEHQTNVYNIFEEYTCLFAHSVHAWKPTYIYISDYVSIDEFECLLWWWGDIDCYMRFVAHPLTEDFMLHFIVQSPLLLIRHIVQRR